MSLRTFKVGVISIHAPRVGGDRRRFDVWHSSIGFQSTPPVWGATMGAVDYESFSEHFNPRPPCGGRQSTRLERELAELFQSTPPVWGATSSPSRDMILDMISIHAPRVGGDRRAARYRRTNL